MKKKISLSLLLIIILGAGLRFYNLNWGSPFYFHPDERNIAGSIARMFFEKTLNPHFFAYGAFWNYIVLFFVKITNFPASPYLSYFSTDPFSRAIQILRFFSALQGVGTIIISYYVGKLLLKNKFIDPRLRGDKLLPFLMATSPGLIQASHFGTFENSLTFLYFLVFYFCLKVFAAVSDRKSFLFYILAVAFFGISISIKITSLILLPILLLVFFKINKKSLISLKSMLSLITLILTPIIIFVLFNPFSFRQWNNPPASASPQAMRAGEAMKQWFLNPFPPDFLSSMHYEQGVALGTIPVFYTQQFQQTTPIAYQFMKILPYVLNPVIWLLFPISLISLISLFLHRKTRNFASLLILFFLLIFIPNSILYVKWTRYVIPSLPYIYIFVFLFLVRFARSSLIVLISLISLIFAIFFTSIYRQDTRIEAAKWAGKNLPQNSKILSEIYDMGIVPFNNVFNYTQIHLFNFYDLDDKNLDKIELTELKTLINEKNAIILPSRRIADTRLRLRNLYPNGFWFYENLKSGKLGFRKIANFSHPYDKIIPFLSPDESFTVFDHPKVEIFTK